MKTKRRTSSRVLAFLLSFIMVATTFINDYTVVRAEGDETVSEASSDSSSSNSSESNSDGGSDESSSEDAGAEDADGEDDGDSEESISEETSDGADSTDEEGSVEGDKAESEEGESEETTEDAESEESEEAESEEELEEEEELPIEEIIVEEEQVVIIFKASEGGSVSMEKQELGEEDDVEAVLATADDGYEFENWTKDGKVVSTDEEFTPDKEEAEYVAHFVAVEEEQLEFNQSVIRKGIKISLYAKPGVLPNDAELRVNTISTSTENKIKEAIDEVTKEAVEETFSFDINIYSASAGGYVQPEDGTVEVRFDLADKDIDDEATLSVYHVETNSAVTSVENVEEVAAPEKGASEIGFDAEHFSIYTVTIQFGNKSNLEVKCIVSGDGKNTEINKTIVANSNESSSLSDISDSIFHNKPYHLTRAYIKKNNNEIDIIDLKYENSKGGSWTYTTKNNQNDTIDSGDQVVFQYELAVTIQVVKMQDKNSHAATNSNGLKYENVYITLSSGDNGSTCAEIADSIKSKLEIDPSFSFDTIRYEGQGNGNEGSKSFDLYALRYKYDESSSEYEIQYKKEADTGWIDFLNDKSPKAVLCAHYLDSSKVITYKANGGTGNDYVETKADNVNYTIKSPSKRFSAPSGQTFIEWNTKADGTGTSYAPGAIYSENADLTLYAQWGYEVYFYLLKPNENPMASGNNSYYPTGNNPEQHYQLKGYVAKTDEYNTDRSKNSIVPIPVEYKVKLSAPAISDLNSYLDETYPNKNYNASQIVWYRLLKKSNDTTSQQKVHYHVDGYIGGVDTKVVYHDGYSNSDNSYEVTVTSGTNHKVLEYADITKFTYRQGYVFEGWATSLEKAQRGDVQYHPGNSIAIMSTYENHLYAVWTENPVYKVTFELNGGKIGDSSADVVQTVVQGGKATAPSPQKAEESGYTYTFAGWKSGNIVYTNAQVNSAIVNANITYVAQWTPVAKEFKISYNGLKDASVSGNPTKYTIKTADIMLNNPSKTGYTFVGWNDDATEAEEKLKDSDVAIRSGSTGDKSFTARWKKNTSTLRLDPNDGVFADGIETEYKEYNGEYGDTLDKIPTPTRVGYTFEGWTKNDGFKGTLENGVYTFGATDGAVDVLTANWRNIEYTITFKNVYTDVQGEVNEVVATEHTGTYHYGDPVVLPTTNPTRLSTDTKNYTFSGWATEENGTVLKTIPNVTNDATYYAVYTESERYVGYTVQYYLQTERNSVSYELAQTNGISDEIKVGVADSKAQAGSILAEDKLAEYAEKTYAGYVYASKLTVNPEFSTEDSTNIVKLYYNLVDYKVVLDANGGTVRLSKTEKNDYDTAKVYYEVDEENSTTSELIYTVKSGNFNLPVEPSISNMGQTFLGWKQVKAHDVWEAIVALFTPKAEVVTITVNANNSPVMTYKANWKENTGTSLYVLLPGHELGKDINEVTATERSRRKNFSPNYYTEKLGTVEVASNLTDTFKGAYYEGQPDDSFGTSVEAYMSGYQYQDSSNLNASTGTLKVNDYNGYSYTADIKSVDWYVVKDSSTSNTPNWHVDGLPDWKKGDAVNYTLAIDLNDSANYKASVEDGVYATKKNDEKTDTVTSTNTTYTVEDTVTITNPTRPGYTFTGWKAYYDGGAQYKNYDGTVANGSIRQGTTGNLTFVAQWKADEYTITYQTYNNATSAFINDNLATKKFNVENVADASLAVIAPAYDGLAFKGWYTEGGVLLTKETEIPATSVLKQADPEEKGAYQNATVVARYNATMTVSADNVTKVYSTYWMSSDVNPVASVEGATIQFFSEKKYYDQAVAGGAIEGIRKQGRMYVRDVAERTEYFVATKDGYEPAFGSAKFTITKRPLILQANSATKKYDGNVLTETGYNVITGTRNINGVEVTGLEMPEYLGGNKNNPIRLTVVTEGSQLYGGTSSNVISRDELKIETTTVPEGRWGKDNSYEATNYDVYLLPGTLKVTEGEIAITVEASDASKVYDGTALTANSYKALSADDKAKLDAAGDHLVVTVEGSATLVSDSVAGNNKVTDVKVYHGDGESTENDVTENYVITKNPGTLTITPKPIVLTAVNVSKQYDGKPFDLSTLDGPVFTVADASVNGETGKVEFIDEHAIAEAGTAGIVGEQYVVPESVSLQVEPVVAGEGKTSLDASGIVIYAPTDGPMLLSDDLDEVSGTMNDNYEIYYAPGTVTITNENPVEVTLTAASGTFTYNGSTFTIDSYARTAQEGFEPDSAIDNWTFTVVDGEEEYEILVNTSATAVGTYTVPFTYVNAEGEVVAVTEDDEIHVYDGVIGAEGTNNVTEYIKVTLVNGSILVNAAPAQGGGGGGGGGRRTAAPAGDVLGAKRREEALVEEGEVLGATRAPKTSDSAKAILWMLVMGSSALGAAAVMAQRKKEEQK